MDSCWNFTGRNCPPDGGCFYPLHCAQAVPGPTRQVYWTSGEPMFGYLSSTGSVFLCDRCRQLKPVGGIENYVGGTGYAVTSDRRLVCYKCCGQMDWLALAETQRQTLYLVKKGAGWFINNWPATMEIPAFDVRTINHPFVPVGQARIAYFFGPNNSIWYVKNIGDNEIAHCRKIRKLPR